VTTNLAPGWRTDIKKVPRGRSVILACQYADSPTHWLQGEAVLERETDGGEWYWASGKLVEPTYVPKAWMDMPPIMMDAEQST